MGKKGKKLHLSGPAIILIVLVVVSSLFINSFIRIGNINNILRQASMLSLVAMGQCIVILLAGIDLSQGSVMGLTGVSTALILSKGVPLVPGIILGLAIAMFCGLINGYLISYVKIPQFVATFGMFGMALGVALVISDSRVIWGFPETVRVIHDGEILGISAPFVIVGIIYLIMFWLLKFTRFGTSIYAIGGNATAAELSGMPVKRNVMLSYGISGLLAGAAGIMLMARMNSARAIMGTGYEFEAIAAVILGGTNRLGGKGGAVETITGVLILAVVRNALNLIGVSVYLQMVAVGFVLIVVYIINQNKGSNPLRKWFPVKNKGLVSGTTGNGNGR
ncbi:MAG: ABC transporter permease [Bacilli bacterium]